jgi:diguanylate cyclase (GGDEF)-like protein
MDGDEPQVGPSSVSRWRLVKALQGATHSLVSWATRSSYERQLQAFFQRARENEGKMQLFKAFELRLIGADALPELFELLLKDFRSSFHHDSVTMVLADADHEIRRMVEEEGSEHPLSLRLLLNRDERAKLTALGFRPILRRYQPAQDEWLFPNTCPPPASVAILPLQRHGIIIGALNLGSGTPDRFRENIGTDFLDHLAAVTGICIENTLNFHRLRRAGLTDPLTQVRNRRFLDARLIEEIARAHRDRQPLAFLFLDIDRFKQVNDDYGHPAADHVLRNVAQRIARALRVNDVLTRYGGEEFATLLPATNAGVAMQVAERVRRSVCDSPFSLPDGGEVPVTISIGVASFEAVETEESLDEQGRWLAGQADQALIRAKREGRNRVVCAQTHSPATSGAICGELTGLRQAAGLASARAAWSEHNLGSRRSLEAPDPVPRH